MIRLGNLLMNKKKPIKPFRQKGFSMIEILISILVLSVGMIGLAMLQTTGVRYSNDAYLKSLAHAYAYEMLDRMRANPEAMDDGVYNFSGGMPSTVPGCSTCTPAENAVRDAYDWNTNIANTFPSGSGSITLAGGRYVITIAYDRRNNDAPSPVCGNDPLINLTCISVEIVQ